MPFHFSFFRHRQQPSSPPAKGSPRGITHRVPRKRLLAGLVLTATVLTPVLACWGPELESVHFHSMRPDFLRMPEPWWRWPGETRAIVRPPQTSSPDDENYSAPGSRPADAVNDEATLDKLAAAALRLETEEQFPQAVVAWQRFAAARQLTHLEGWQISHADRNYGLEDRTRALGAWRGSQDTPALRAYLTARQRIEDGQLVGIGDLLQAADTGAFQVHAAYLRAVVAFYLGTPDESATSFREVVKRHPGYAPALYMIGRTYFAAAYELDDGSGAPPDARRSQYLRQALEAYEECARLSTANPLAQEAAGMAAACRYRLGDYPEALGTYCRALAKLSPGQDDSDAFTSARWCLSRMNGAAHERFQRLAASDPEAAVVYLNLILRYGRSSAGTNYRLGLFALDLLKRHPSLEVSGRLLTQLSTIEDRAGHADRAERLAAQALRRASRPADRDEARWAHALALHHVGKHPAALREYEQVASEAALPRMRAGAHEAAAVLSERQRDYPNALRHYFALGYRKDAAYVADCLASPEDLRAFGTRFPSHPQVKLIRYSLGFRQLRAGQYTAAAETFSALGPWLETAEKSYVVKTSKKQPRTPPLQAARLLADLQRQERTAKSPDEKAHAAYAAGQFMFHQRHLLFYNGALWQGERTWALGLNGPYNVETQAIKVSPQEDASVRVYQEEHAAVFQALRVFRRVADEYPRTPEAPKALYSAALCYSFLPSLESFWGSRTDLNYEREGIKLYQRLQREYPGDPLVAAAARFGGPVSGAAGGTP